MAKKTIRAYTSYNDYRKIHYYTDFEVIDKLPSLDDKSFGGYDAWNYEDFKILEINSVHLDCEQGSQEVYNYDYYEIVIQYKDDDKLEKDHFYVAIEKPEEEFEDDEEN